MLHDIQFAATFYGLRNEIAIKSAFSAETLQRYSLERLNAYEQYLTVINR